MDRSGGGVRGVSRRRCLRVLGSGAVGLTAAGLLAACGAGGTAAVGTGTVSAASVPSASVSAGSTSAASATTSAKAATSSAGTASGPTPTPVPAPPSSGKGTVVFQSPGLGIDEAKPFQQIVSDFQKKTGINVTYVDTGESFEKFAVQYAGGSGGDLYEYETKVVPHYATLGVFENLDPYIAKSTIIRPEEYFAITWNKGKIQGHQFAVPWDTTPVVVFYNKDLFQQAGIKPPSTTWGDEAWDWNAFLSAAQKLTNPEHTVFGCTISTWWVYSLPWIWSNGGHVVNEALTKVQFSQQAVQDAFQYLVDLAWKYNVWAHTGQKDKGFNTGGDAMFLSGPYSIPGLRDGAKVPWNVGVVPTGKAGVWTRDPSDSLTIWNGSKNKDQAFQLMEYITGPDGQLVIGQSGRGVPARKSVAQSKAFLEQGDGIDWKVFAEGPDHEGLQAVTDVWPEMDTEMGKLIGPMWANKATVAATTTQMDQVIQAILDKATVRRDLSASYLPQGWKSPAYS
jgi:multiple sugar transport system substrate-binding protein